VQRKLSLPQISTNIVEQLRVALAAARRKKPAAFEWEAACSASPKAKARDAKATTPGIVFPALPSEGIYDEHDVKFDPDIR